MLIHEKIFYLIEKNRLTQKEFSELTGISQSTISDWKRKKTNPSADRILKICEVLKVTPYELLSESDIQKSVKTDCLIAVDEERRNENERRNAKAAACISRRDIFAGSDINK